MSTPGDGRKVAQLRNDVDDIYDMLGGINATLDQHTATLDQHTATLDQHTATLAEHGTKLDHIIEVLEGR
jgi:ABC-type transporter Mla subunit MlaD